LQSLLDELIARANHALDIHDVAALRACIEVADTLLPSLNALLASRLQADRYRWRGVRCAVIGDQPSALAAFTEALAAYTAIGDGAGITRSMVNIVKSYSNVGDTAQALRWYHQALDRCTEDADDVTKALLHLNIGNVHSMCGEIDVKGKGLMTTYWLEPS